MTSAQRQRGAPAGRKPSSASDLTVVTDGLGQASPYSIERILPQKPAKARRPPAKHGYRGRINRLPGVHLPPERMELNRRAIAGSIIGRVVVALQKKGGSGKTTTSLTLGQTIQGFNRDHVIVLDLNLDRGTISNKVGASKALAESKTVNHLARQAAEIRSVGDMRAYAHRVATTGLDVVFSPTDPAAIGAAEFTAIMNCLKPHYCVIIDCGTRFDHPVMPAICRYADQVVIPTQTGSDSLEQALETLNALVAMGYPDLADDALMVINRFNRRNLLDRRAARSRTKSLYSQYGLRTFRVPFDKNLEDAHRFRHVSVPTAFAYLDLAAAVVNGFQDQAKAGSVAPPQTKGRRRFTTSAVAGVVAAGVGLTPAAHADTQVRLPDPPGAPTVPTTAPPPPVTVKQVAPTTTTPVAPVTPTTAPPPPVAVNSQPAATVATETQTRSGVAGPDAAAVQREVDKAASATAGEPAAEPAGGGTVTRQEHSSVSGGTATVSTGNQRAVGNVTADPAAAPEAPAAAPAEGTAPQAAVTAAPSAQTQAGKADQAQTVPGPVAAPSVAAPGLAASPNTRATPRRFTAPNSPPPSAD
ncbi:AAA family ATPase, partial [Candidatus Parcubacteria bacterium]|nr:AAA family ATPase [Candidatus Parcubacteria bacterium]